MSEHPEYIRGVKDCIAALPEPTFVVGAARDNYELAKINLQALLPKPDHAKAAVEEWKRTRDPAWQEFLQDDFITFARWLEEQGIDLSRWGE